MHCKSTRTPETPDVEVGGVVGALGLLTVLAMDPNWGQSRTLLITLRQAICLPLRQHAQQLRTRFQFLIRHGITNPEVGIPLTEEAAGMIKQLLAMAFSMNW